MTKSSTSNLEPFDHEIERTFRKLRNLVKKNLSPRKKVKMEEAPAPGAAIGVGTGIGAVIEVAEAQNDRRTLMEYAQALIDGTASCIRKPVQANNYELRPSYV